jgi:hypothetical protein
LKYSLTIILTTSGIVAILLTFRSSSRPFTMSWEVRDRDKMMRELEREDTPIPKGYQTLHEDRFWILPNSNLMKSIG